MKFIKNRKGQSLVETALTLPIIILVLTGIIDFGMLFNNYLVISNASREGARKAAVGISDTELVGYIQGLTSSLNSEDVNIMISPTETSRETGNTVTVIIGLDNYLLTPIISAFAPNPLHIEAKTVMRVE